MMEGLIALASGLGSGCLGFVLGLRVCGPKLQVCWTERHPREIAHELLAGRITARELTPASRQLVAGELARMRNGLTVGESSEFLTVTGVGDRFAGHPEPYWAHSETDVTR
jgi:hypothetical protein